jgi:hypothetical protein
MIKLLRTHPRHLAGMDSTPSKSPHFPIHGPHEAPRFGRLLQEALDTEGGLLDPDKKATPRPHDSACRHFSSNEIHRSHRISTTDPAETDPPSKTGSVSPPSPRSSDYEPLIEEASRDFGVAKDLIRAVIRAESNFDPRAKSRSGAIGLMQLLPSTGRELGISNLYDPRDNIMGGTRYLAMLLGRYQGNLELALAAYNWGLGNVDKSPDRLPRETETYIQKVLKYRGILTA